MDPGDARQLLSVSAGVRAYLVTWLFEFEVGNGGLHQFFFNHPDPDLFALVVEGYSFLGLEEVRQVLEEVVGPIAEAEGLWRESLRDGTVETFFGSYPESQLPEHNDKVGVHHRERLRYVRAYPELFAG